ncbi:DUF445 domain-containing protein [Palleronia caenipelagi]|uniref:DUF445 domain-containing protein n=1 Tax=Palleronia caenipelagi TaxID=2489174 RepID=A0A547Q2T4_9RHOB|nr:DUF445 domain-containing protein [Palleronia caenipelagi]TRD20694.1 DUF445 domain-containing protein [Palleronia caenipelagi]
MALTGADGTPPAGEILARNRRWATGVLVALTALFLLTYVAPEPGHLLLLLRSMAEAGMVGGLADWFAVTALFRHPLGLPIPHTALLPRNQQRAAENAGRFFDTHFLDPVQLEGRLRALGPSRVLKEWIDAPGNAEQLADEAVSALSAVMRDGVPPRALVRVRRWLRHEAESAVPDAAIAERITDLLKAGLRGQATDEILRVVRDTIDGNRELAVALVQENSRWWIASTVDRRVATLVFNAVLALLDDLQRPEAPLRQDFDRALDLIIDRLERDGAIAGAVREARHHLVESDTFDQTFAAILHEVQARMTRKLDTQPEAVRANLAQTLRDVTDHALGTEAARQAFDTRFAALAAKVVAGSRTQIASYVTDVIAGWEPEELNERFEEQIGPDLQFIRINGALLGAMIGGGLYAVELILG